MAGLSAEAVRELRRLEAAILRATRGARSREVARVRKAARPARTRESQDGEAWVRRMMQDRMGRDC